MAGVLLDDINWRLGEATVWGKGNRRERLSLQADVSEAIVASLLDARPAAGHREVFWVRPAAAAADDPWRDTECCAVRRSGQARALCTRTARGIRWPRHP